MISDLFAKGTIIRGRWSRSDDGRELLCLSDAVTRSKDYQPVENRFAVCPKWLVDLIDWISCLGSEEEWPSVIERVSAIHLHLSKLSPTVEYRVRALCVREAMRYTTLPDVLRACSGIASLNDRAAAGDIAADDEWEDSADAHASVETWAETVVGYAMADWASRNAVSIEGGDDDLMVEAALSWADEEMGAGVKAADRLTRQILSCLEASLAIIPPMPMSSNDAQG